MGAKLLEKDIFYMKQALKEAQKAFAQEEVPVGAIIVHQETGVLAVGFNKREGLHSPLGHAEIEAITGASHKLQSWRLEGCTLYSTLEPCLMCIGACLQARVSRLVYGSKDLKKGFDSFYQMTKQDTWSQSLEISHGILEKECSQILKVFFQNLRAKKKES